jgi:hypothetical protein
VAATFEKANTYVFAAPIIRDREVGGDLATWVMDHRGELIWAALIMVNEWLALGKPLSQCKRLASFERWSDTIGGILGAVGIPGFLDSLNLLYEATDLEGATFKIFVEEWWDEFQDRKLSVSELFPVAERLDNFELHGHNEQAGRIFRKGNCPSSRSSVWQVAHCFFRHFPASRGVEIESGSVSV